MAIKYLTKAIPQDRYVRITSVGVGDAQFNGRSFGGLVFSQGKGWSPSSSAGAGVVWEPDMLVVVGSADAAMKYFASDSAEVAFARRYFAYLSPSGSTPRILTFARVNVTDDSDNTLGYVKYTPTGSTTPTYGWFTAEDIEEGVETATPVASPTIETPAEALARVAIGTNNFGSFCFIDDYTCDALKTAAELNAGYNNKFLMSFATSEDPNGTQPSITRKEDITSSTTLSQVTARAFADYLLAANADGIDGLSFKKGDSVLSAELDMAIFASVDYGGENTAPTMMYKQHTGEKATVFDGDEASELDDRNVNYYGRVQGNGNVRDFYQRGKNFDGTDTGVYCNEIWLKSFVATSILNQQLAMEKIPGNTTGGNIIYTIVDSCARQGVTNGSIEQDKTLTKEQEIAVLQLSGGAVSAVENVSRDGYWISVQVEEDETTHDKKAVYRLIYAKGDAIKFVDGTHALV